MAINDTIIIKGLTYYDTPSRMFGVVRLQSFLKHIFPQLKKGKTPYELVIFLDPQKRNEYLTKHPKACIILNLFCETETK